MPGYGVFEYMLLVYPHAELGNRVMQIKKEFQETYQVESGMGGKPNMGLVNFIQYEMMEERIINRLRTVAMGYPPFKVELKDFRKFPFSHDIYRHYIQSAGAEPGETDT